MEQQFERQIINFDESRFNNELRDLTNLCNAINLAIDDISAEHEIEFTTEGVKMIFLDRDYKKFTSALFSKLRPKNVRNEAILEVEDALNEIFFSVGLEVNKDRLQYLKAFRGKIYFDKDQENLFKRRFETSLDSSRAVEIYNKQCALFEGLNELLDVVNSGGRNVPANFFYEMDISGNFVMRKLDYNNI